MKAIRHVFRQPFLVAVSLAALVHSAWAFSTLFTGLEPMPQFSGAWFAWMIPGLLLAFAVDIGLLSLANQIRMGQRSRGKLAAFFVLCIAMGFMQFLYIMHHVPEVSLGAGVRAEWVGLVSLLRDFSIWILPCLMPTALCLFAFSDTVAPSHTHEINTPSDTITVSDSAPMPAQLPDPSSAPAPALPEKIEIECPDCGEWSGSYDSDLSARMALRAHVRHCKHSRVELSMNGAQ